MQKIAIVILNYLNYKDTIACVKSLTKVKYYHKEVIIVENGSSNKSWDVLNNMYGKSNVHILKSDENLGFAQGNNIGIEYARNKLDCNFVLLVNNDTIFRDVNILTRLAESYEIGIAAIGSRIITADGFNQNPVGILRIEEKVEKDYHHLINIKKDNFDHHLTIKDRLKRIKFLKQIIRRLKRIGRNKINVTKESRPEITSGELLLHGACILLTPDYFKYYPKLFPKTFLYHEEDILNILINKVGLKCRYINDVYIYHKEDQSSEMSFNNLIEKKAQYALDSLMYGRKLLELSYNKIVKSYF